MVTENRWNSDSAHDFSLIFQQQQREREKVSSTCNFSIDKPSVILYTAVFQKKKCSGYVKMYTYSHSPQLFALFGNISSV